MTKLSGIALAALFVVGLFYRKPVKDDAPIFMHPVSHTFH